MADKCVFFIVFYKKGLKMVDNGQKCAYNEDILVKGGY